MPTPTQESIYNGALTILRERKLASTSEGVPSRYHLDLEYAKCLAYMLEQGDWAFASRFATLTQSGTPSGGYSYVLPKPADYVRLIGIGATNDLFPGLETYDEIGASWLANVSTAYIQYVSDDATNGGGNLAFWPETYTRAVEWNLAVRIAGLLTATKGDEMKALAERAEAALDLALDKDQVKAVGRPPAAGTAAAIYAGALTTIGQRYPRGAHLAKAIFQILAVEYPKALAFTLQQANWSFAQRLATITASGSPTGGYTYVYPKPADFARLIAISDFQNLWPTLGAYDDNAASWQANCSALYVAYVSDGASYGADVSKWPSAFADAVEANLAARLASQLLAIGPDAGALDAAAYQTLAEKVGKLEERAQALLGVAIATDASDGTVGRPPTLGTASAVYAGALALIRQRYTKPIGDSKELRQTLDTEYTKSVQYMLEQGLWNFAQRTYAIDASTDVEPAFGYSYAFEKPEDYVRLVAISNNENLWPTLDRYDDSADIWSADCDPLYVTFISDHSSLGWALARWPASFLKAVEHDLARRVAATLPSFPAGALDILDSQAKRALADARSKDAMNQAVMRPPPGRLTQARAGWRVPNRGWRVP